MLNDIAREDSNNVICKQIDFKNNKYLPKLFIATSEFKKTYNKMLSILNQNSTDSVKNTLLSLSQNKETKKQFEEFGVNFARWTEFNPMSKVHKMITPEYQQKIVLKNITDVFNSMLFSLIAEDKKEELYKVMKANGYELKKQHLPFYDEEEFKLLKDKNSISYDDLPFLINILAAFMKKISLWNGKDKDSLNSSAKKGFENTINEIQDKIKLLKNQKIDQIAVQQVDMNNIAHSLFLGNDSSCCMAIGSGIKQALAPNYVMNKMLSAIEVLVNNKSVGNTMCYVAEIDSKPVLILDNVELKPDYRHNYLNDIIRDMIFSYSKKFAKELGVSDMSIYIGSNRNKINLKACSMLYKDIRILGSSGDDVLYIDSISKNDKFNGKQKYRVLLYDISKVNSNNININKNQSKLINNI